MLQAFNRAVQPQDPPLYWLLPSKRCLISSASRKDAELQAFAVSLMDVCACGWGNWGGAPSQNCFHTDPSLQQEGTKERHHAVREHCWV